MRIERPLLKLPIRFCAETLSREVKSLPEAVWRPHPQNFDGNIAVPLVSPGGAVTDQWVGAMGPTQVLNQCPYILDIMRELDSTWGRSRLMGLEPEAIVPEHVDVHYYWRTHLRIHIPVITNPRVLFHCDDQSVHMEAGDCWLLDSFFRHSVENRGPETRVHLVLDTVGSAHLWDLIDAALGGVTETAFVPPGKDRGKPLQYEQINAPIVMSPWEIKCHIAYVREWMDDDPQLPKIERMLDRFVTAWSGTWATHGASDAGLPSYVAHLKDVRAALASVAAPPVMMRNGWPLLDSLNRYVFGNAIAPTNVRQALAATGRGAHMRLTA